MIDTADHASGSAIDTMRHLGRSSPSQRWRDFHGRIGNNRAVGDTSTANQADPGDPAPIHGERPDPAPPVAPSRLAQVADQARAAVVAVSGREWAWVGLAVAIAIFGRFVDSRFDTSATSRLDVEHTDLYASAIGQVLTAAVLAAVLVGLGWDHEAALTSQRRQGRLRSSWVLLVGVVVPLLAVTDSSWDAPGRLGATVVDLATLALFDGLLLRGLVFVLVARCLARHRHGVLMAAIVVSVLFGVLNTNVVLPFLGLALIWLTVETRSVWPSVAVHFGYELFADVPFDAAGEPQGSAWGIVGGVVVIVAGVLAARHLAEVDDPWPALMSQNVAPVSLATE